MAIGTSGNVYPAAGFVKLARGHTVELNLEPTVQGSNFQEKQYGPATEIVPPYIADLLA
jgi:NAD-dependent deacetylase